MTSITPAEANAVQHLQQLHQERANQAMLTTMEKTSSLFLGLALVIGALLITGPIGFLFTATLVTSAVLLLACGSARGRYIPDHDHGHRSSGWRIRLPAFPSYPAAPPINRPVYLPAQEQRRGARFRTDPEVRVPVGHGRY
ncbi:MAG: hypothetical protein V4492_09200 [Chlamydiota bacterium]